MRYVSMFILPAIVIPLALLLSCTSGTYVVLNLETGSAAPSGVTKLDIDTRLGEKASHVTLEPGGEIVFPTAVTLDLGSAAGALMVQVSGKNQSAVEVAQGTGSIEASAGATTSLTVRLRPVTKLEITPTSQDLGLVAPGGRAEAVFVVRNVGAIMSGGLTVSLNGEEFMLSSNGCMGALPAGWSCTVKVELQPTAAGDKTARLTVSGDPGGSVAATLSGQGNWYLWSKRFGGPGNEGGSDAAVDGSGNVVIVGSFLGTADFGGALLTSAAYTDAFVVKYGADGRHLWSKRFGGGSYDSAQAVAMDRSGNVLVAGSFEKTVDFGGGPLTSTGTPDIFLAKYDANGTHVWSRRFGGVGSATAWSLVVDGSGNALLVGEFSGTADFGGGLLTSAGNTDIVVAKYSPSGTHLWSKRFGGAGYDNAWAVAVEDGGNAVVAGAFEGTVDFGGGPLTSAGSGDGFVARYDAAGAPLWSKRLGGSGDDRARAVSVDRGGNVVVAGEFLGTADFGGGPLTSAGSSDAFVARYDSKGAHLWSKRLGGTGTDSAWAVATTVSGTLLLAGDFSDSVDFGGGGLTSAGSSDVFVAEYAAGGTHLWSKRFGGIGADTAEAVAIDGTGNAFITGDFNGSVDFGGGPLISTGREDGFVLKLAPQRNVNP